MGNDGGLKVLRALFSILILVLFLVVGMLQSVKSETDSINLSKSEEVAADKLLQVHPKSSDFNYNMSKRRVPNGPDPIHNRRAGNSGRPPGQA